MYMEIYAQIASTSHVDYLVHVTCTMYMLHVHGCTVYSTHYMQVKDAVLIAFLGELKRNKTVIIFSANQFIQYEMYLNVDWSNSLAPAITINSVCD